MRLIRHPLSWLILVLLATYLGFAATGGLKPVKTRDSPSYITASRVETLEEALSLHRTMGFPLALRLLADQDGSFEAVPRIQLLAYLASILLFWHAVRRYTASRWLAFAAALPLPFAGVMILVNKIGPDFLAAACTVCALSLLLLLTVRTTSRLLWVALPLAVFSSYQLRPAGVLLVPFIPVFGTVLWLCGGGGWSRRLARWAGGLALAMLLPWTLFAGLRWVVVGDFGLVSFGGCNMSGMVASFLSPEVIADLPPEHRSMAGRIYNRRVRRRWAPLTVNDDPAPWFEQYSDNMWHISMEVGKAQLKRESRRAFAAGEGDRKGLRPTWRVELNKRLTSLSWAVIRTRPLLYLRWVRASFLYGIGQLPSFAWIVWPLVLLAASWPMAWLHADREGPKAGSDRSLLGLFLLGTGFFAGYLLVLALVSFPFQRYLVSTTLLLPSVLSAELFAVWSRVLTKPSATVSSSPGLPDRVEPAAPAAKGRPPLD